MGVGVGLGSGTARNVFSMLEEPVEPGSARIGVSSERAQTRKREVLQGKGEHAPLCTFRSSSPKRSKLSINVSCKLFMSWLKAY